jgi:hypothetical protein
LIYLGNEAWINSTPLFEGSTTTMTSLDTAATTEATRATAKQKIIAAMWRLGRPATAKDIATAAAIGYSTATPLLRTLLGADQVIKTTVDDGSTLWQLNLDAAEAADDSSEPGAAETSETSDVVPGIDTVADPGVGAHPHEAPEQPATDPVPPEEPHHDTTRAAADMPDVNATAGPIADVSAPASDDTTELSATPEAAATPDGEQSAARSYSKPQHPRRAKGALRDAVLAVLQSEPDRAFKIMEICKAINAGNTDQSANKAGAGAVVNACDKLAGSGEAIRLDSKPATFQAVT